jgi:hypothetical protein
MAGDAKGHADALVSEALLNYVGGARHAVVPTLLIPTTVRIKRRIGVLRLGYVTTRT